MHSNHWKFLAWIMSLALVGGQPGSAWAEIDVTDAQRAECFAQTGKDDLPVRGSNNERDKINLCRLDREVERLRKEVREARDESSELTKQAELDRVLEERAPIFSRVRRADKKLAKVEKKEKRIAELSQDIAELESSKAGISAEEIVEIDSKIDFLRGRIASKEKAIARKERKYEKISGDKVPAKIPSPVPSPVAPEVVKTLTTLEKMEEAACWTKQETPLSETLSVFFPMGKADLEEETKDGHVVGDGSLQKLKELFATRSKAMAKSLFDKGYRIWKIEATSHTSKVPYSKTKRTPDELADLRSDAAASEFMANISIGSPVYKMKTPDYEEPVPVDPKGAVAVGPPAYRVKNKAGKLVSGYGALAKNTFKGKDAAKEAELKKQAKAIFESYDPTPVRGKTEDETLANLIECCSTSAGTMRYQPYQFTTLTFYVAKFDENSDACIHHAKKVASGTAPKALDDDYNCVPGPANEFDCSGYSGYTPVEKSKRATKVK